MSIIVLSYLPSVLGIGLLAVVIYLNNPKARINRTFTVFASGVFLWLFALMLADTATSDAGALWSLRAALFIGSIIGTSFLSFADSFPDEKMRTISDRTLKILWSITAVSMILSLTDYMIPSVANSETESTLESITPAYGLQTIFVLGQMFVGAFLTLRRRHRVTPQQRNQIQFFAYGMMVTIFASIVPNVVFIILDVTSIWTPFLTSFSYFVLVLSVWFAITRHQLFHIRGIVARAIAYLASGILVASAYAFLVTQQINRHVSHNSLRIISVGVSFLLAIAVFRRIVGVFNRATNHLFYKEAYDSQVALGKLTKALVSHIELAELIEASKRVLIPTLKPESADIVIYGMPKTAVPEAVDSEVRSALQIVMPARSKPGSWRFVNVESTSKVNEACMRAARIQLIVPIYTANKLEGCMALGPRSSGDVYSKQDLDFLKIAARNIGLAVNNARSYQQIAAFNTTLQEKINDATNELRSKNLQLEALHRTKDDFISMASHQLKPKITASMGFLELLDRSEIKANKEQRELLDLTKEGIKRMSDIVLDMLDISRMDAEALQLDLSVEPVDVKDIVMEEIHMFRKRHGSRQFRKDDDPAHTSCKAQVDVIKLREVIANLLSNAVQYSSKGSEIVIHMQCDSESLTVTVQDSGIGMSTAEKRSLFQKFYRSEAAKRVRPTGSGVGLYMSKKIIEAHGGTMIVTSQKGAGSTIGFRLPKN